MNVRRLRSTQVLVLLGLVGTSVQAEAAEPDVPQGLDLRFRASTGPAPTPPSDDGFAVEDEAEPPPDDGFAVEDESPPEGEDEGEVIMPSAQPKEPEGEDEGEVIMPSAQPKADEGKAGKKEPPPDDGEWTFEVEDVSEDPSAVEQEVKAATVEATKGPAGTVKGKLRDSVTGDPLIGATVEVVNGKYKTKTDANGEFSLRLPPGVYELRLRSDASQPLRVSNVEVRQDGTVDLNRELRPLEGAGQVVKVEAEMNRESEGARLLQRKESVSARDLLSRDEIAKSGGGSTSSVARRIVGSTVVGGRYLFIRGLGHRYGNTLFDGARVPSPEPELRTVPLDIFPSGALSAINVQKTFTPDVPGDFAGGSTQLESREVPDEFIFEVGADIGANTATTGRRMVTSAGFTGADAFGFGNLPRAIPDVLPNDVPVGPSALDPETLRPVWTAEDTERFGESLLPDTRIRRGALAPPNFGVKATTGWGREYGDDGKIGFLAAASYKHKHETLREQVRVFGLSGDTLDLDTPRTDYRGVRTTFGVAWSGIGLVKWKLNKNHRLEALGFYSRDADDETRIYAGQARNVAQGVDLVTNTRLRYVMRSIAMTRLGGKHTFPKAKGLQLDWILETHAHADHISAAQHLKRELGGQIAIGEGITQVQATFVPVFGLEGEVAPDGSQFDRLFRDGDVFQVGGIAARVLHTPGHTNDSVTYVIGDAAFVGDTMFMPDGGTARCDFPGGDARRLYRSLQRILALPADTRLFMCHDYQPGGRELRYETTIAAQRESNIHLKGGASEDDFVRMREARDATLSMPNLIVQSIQVNIRAGQLPDPDGQGRRFLKTPLDLLGRPLRKA